MCVFESMAATYQPTAEHKHQPNSVDNPSAVARHHDQGRGPPDTDGLARDMA